MRKFVVLIIVIALCAGFVEPSNEHQLEKNVYGKLRLDVEETQDIDSAAALRFKRYVLGRRRGVAPRVKISQLE